MGMITMSNRAFAWPLLAVVLALGLSAFAAPASAKQCVWNKGGYVMRVDWFAPGDFTMAVNPNDGAEEYTFTVQPIQTDKIWSGSGRCIDRGDTEYWALLSICGASFNTRVLDYPDTWPESRRIDCSIHTFMTPSLTQYLDAWGPVWAPEYGNGGAI
jgi:hypothetical protein